MQERGEAYLKITAVRWAAVLRDVHFWVPVIVLLIGILLLSIAR